MVNIIEKSMVKNFYYTSTPENEGVLFHIPTGRFFRVFDEKYKSDFEKTSDNGKISKEGLDMLEKIDTEQKTNVCSNKKCNKKIEYAKDFMVRKRRLF